MLCSPSSLQDCDIYQMRVHWALEGALLWNLCTAMCIAPILHQQPPLNVRCEVALTGFICLDLFALLSHDKERKMGWPSGSAFLARQTREVLQACALSAVVLTLTKSAEEELFSRGFGRLSELGIEQWFGCLRTQHANAQMACRGYFRSSARHALKISKDLNGLKAPKNGGEKCLGTRESLGKTRHCLDMFGFDLHSHAFSIHKYT